MSGNPNHIFPLVTYSNFMVLFGNGAVFYSFLCFVVELDFIGLDWIGEEWSGFFTECTDRGKREWNPADFECGTSWMT